MATSAAIQPDAGTEVGRIEGYAGDEFFWVMLAQMLTRTGWDPATPARPVEAVPPDAAAPQGTPAAPAPAADPT